MLVAFWNERTAREKKLLIVALACAILVLSYFVISGLHAKRKALQESMEYQQELLQWMHQNAPLLKSSVVEPRQQDIKDLFSIIDAHFKNNIMVDKLYISRLSDNRVSINFKEISFNELLKELLALKKQYNIQVDELQVSRMGGAGLVEGRVIVKS